MASLVSIMANTFEGKIEGVYNNVDYNVTSNPPPTTTTPHLDISIGLFRGDIPSKSSRGTPGPLALWSIPGEHHQTSRCVKSTKVPKGTKRYKEITKGTKRYKRYKHRKNCECCPVSQLIVRSQRLS